MVAHNIIGGCTFRSTVCIINEAQGIFLFISGSILFYRSVSSQFHLDDAFIRLISARILIFRQIDGHIICQGDATALLCIIEVRKLLMGKRCSPFTICIFTRHTIALIIIVEELHTMYTPSVFLHFAAQIHLHLGYRPQQVDIREILTLAGSKCKGNFLDAPHGQILRLCFVIKRLLGDIRIVVVFLQVILTHIEIGINHHFSFKIIAHKYLIAHRQRTC